MSQVWAKMQNVKKYDQNQRIRTCSVATSAPKISQMNPICLPHPPFSLSQAGFHIPIFYLLLPCMQFVRILHKHWSLSVLGPKPPLPADGVFIGTGSNSYTWESILVTQYSPLTFVSSPLLCASCLKHLSSLLLWFLLLIHFEKLWSWIFHLRNAAKQGVVQTSLNTWWLSLFTSLFTLIPSNILYGFSKDSV